VGGCVCVGGGGVGGWVCGVGGCVVWGGVAGFSPPPPSPYNVPSYNFGVFSTELVEICVTYT